MKYLKILLIAAAVSIALSACATNNTNTVPQSSGCATR